MASRPSLPSVSMSQTSIIVAALLIGFIVFITMKGQLAAWGALFTSGPSNGSGSTAPATPAAPAGNNGGGTASGILSLLGGL